MLSSTQCFPIEELHAQPAFAQARWLLAAEREVTEADRFAADIMPIVEAIRSAGACSLASIADALNLAELGVDADPFMLHLYAALAEKERRLISLLGPVAEVERAKSGQSQIAALPSSVRVK